jgi:hypothetical protein
VPEPTTGMLVFAILLVGAGTRERRSAANATRARERNDTQYGENFRFQKGEHWHISATSVLAPAAEDHWVVGASPRFCPG